MATAAEQISQQKVKTALIGIGTLGGAYYAFKKQKGLVTIILFGIAGGILGGVVNSVYQSVK